MATQEYLESLRNLHRHLDQAINEELLRPNPDNMAVSRLKREKLRIKDEIAQLGELGNAATSTEVH